MATVTPLNPIAAHDPIKSFDQNLFWKRTWNVALAISVVAFTALGVLAISLANTYCPIHLPLVSIMVLAGGLPLSSSLVTKIWKKAEYYRKEVLYDQMLKERVESLSSEELHQSLRSLGISTDASEDVIKSLLSRYYLLKQQATPIVQTSEDKDDVEIWANKKLHVIKPSDYHISKIDFDDPDQVELFEALQLYQLNKASQLENAARAHLTAAYILYLIQNPTDTRQIEDFVQFTDISPIRRLIAQHAGDPSADIFAKDENRTYTKSRILAAKAEELAIRIFGLRRNWF